MQPRHFWRRAFALLIDSFLINLLTLAILLPLHWLAPNHFVVLDGYINNHYCQNLPAPPEKFAKEIPAGFFAESQQVHFKLCQVSHYFFTGGYVGTASTVHQAEGGNYTESKSFGMTTNNQGEPIAAIDPSEILIAVFITFGFAFLLSRKNGQTLGKQILGLQVVAINQNGPPNFKAYLIREALKSIFVIFTACFALFGILLTVSGNSSSVLLAVFQIPFIVIMLNVIMLIFGTVWYILPLIRWRGQMIYDRITGFEVTRPLGGEIEKAAWFR